MVLKFRDPGLTGGGTMNSLIVLVLLMAAATALFYQIFTGIVKRRRLKDRISRFVSTRGSGEAKTKEREKFSFIEKAGKGLKFIPSRKKTEVLLQQAGTSLTGPEFLAVRVGGSIMTAVVFWMFSDSWLALAAAVPIGFFIPVLYMKRKRTKRLQLLTYQLVETLGTMANSLRAGFSFMQAMQMVAKEMPDPLGPEFGRVVREISLGRPTAEALQRMSERLPNKELEVIVQGIIAQRESGGNLAELLLAMEETISGRIRVLDELKTLVTQGKMSSWIITLLPVGVGVFMYMFNYEYMSIMVEHPLGLTLLFFTALSILLGWLMIQKVIRIEV
ncbi:secretion system protein [Alkalicoccus saliphilus]|uniref:Secretion system protein n=2 Tax=Alkalicoccus saliphilus TaxID=200989 RepID=A0A2T4U6Y4_9BACI|nr:secretion system protein [Alkalicoccus saliphilus]